MNTALDVELKSALFRILEKGSADESIAKDCGGRPNSYFEYNPFEKRIDIQKFPTIIFVRQMKKVHTIIVGMAINKTQTATNFSMMVIIVLTLRKHYTSTLNYISLYTYT